MPSPVDSYPVNTDKIIFALTELEKTATGANAKPPFLNVFFFQPMRAVVLDATADGWCTSAACLTSSERINEVRLRRVAPQRHLFITSSPLAFTQSARNVNK